MPRKLQHKSQATLLVHRWHHNWSWVRKLHRISVITLTNSSVTPTAFVPISGISEETALPSPMGRCSNSSHRQRVEGKEKTASDLLALILSSHVAGEQDQIEVRAGSDWACLEAPPEVTHHYSGLAHLCIFNTNVDFLNWLTVTSFQGLDWIKHPTRPI